MAELTVEQINSYLSFRLGDELFAANVGKVLEILEMRQITKVPRAPEYMRGVINLRGGVLPVVDTRIKFGMSETVPTIDTCIVVIELELDGETIMMGAMIDAVQEVLDIKEEDIKPPPSIGSKYKSEFIRGMGKVDDNFIMILDIDKVFSSDELSILSEHHEEQDQEED